MSHDYISKERPYALYIHGMGSGAKSGTKTSLGHYLEGYEWLSPELPTDPELAVAILDDYAQVFQPQLVAGTSMGGLYTLFVKAPEAIKVAINPTYNVEVTLRKLGYGKHKYHCERENGETEYVIDEPLVMKYIHLRDSRHVEPSQRMIALFSSDDELVGREPSKQNAKALESIGYEIYWSDKFGHRLNQPAAKKLASIIASK